MDISKAGTNSSVVVPLSMAISVVALSLEVTKPVVLACLPHFSLASMFGVGAAGGAEGGDQQKQTGGVSAETVEDQGRQFASTTRS